MRYLLVNGLKSALLFTILMVGLLAVQPDQQNNVKIPPLVKQLGDTEYEKREAAERELLAIGEEAIPKLKEAIHKSDDLEVRWRARDLIRDIMLAARTSQSTGLQMAVIPAGKFIMGSPPKEYRRRADEDQHEVIITELFLLGRHEVTQAQFEKVMGTNPSWFSKNGKGRAKVQGQKTDWLSRRRSDLVSSHRFLQSVKQAGRLQALLQIDERAQDKGPDHLRRRQHCGRKRLSTSHRSGMGICLSRRKHDDVSLWQAQHRSRSQSEIRGLDRWIRWLYHPQPGTYESSGKLSSQRVESLRHARQRRRVVLGSVREKLLQQVSKERSERSG